MPAEQCTSDHSKNHYMDSGHYPAADHSMDSAADCIVADYIVVGYNRYSVADHIVADYNRYSVADHIVVD